MELGEKVLTMVGLLKSEECYSANNYNHRIIHARFSNQIIVTVPGSTDASLEQVHEKKIKVLQDRLSQYFQQIYPQFEYELKYFSYDNEKFIDSMVNAYLEQLVVHHHHYFPDMDPIGMAHNFCNVVTYTKGQPPAHIYVHNLTNFDSSFILKMIPPDVMAHKGKNTEKQWSVICPPGNKNKMKLLMTPFGTFSDSMNFFQASLAKMAEEMNSSDIEELYKLHVRYFKTNTQFKVVLKNREREGKPFTLDRFKSMFIGKLIFPYDSFEDIDWLYCKSETLPEIEAFCENKMGKEWPTAKEYLNMARNIQVLRMFNNERFTAHLHIRRWYVTSS